MKTLAMILMATLCGYVLLQVIHGAALYERRVAAEIRRANQ